MLQYFLSEEASSIVKRLADCVIEGGPKEKSRTRIRAIKLLDHGKRRKTVLRKEDLSMT
jgi:hypothetical protein